MEEAKLGLEISSVAERLRKANRGAHAQVNTEDVAEMISAVLDALAVRVNHWERDILRSGKVG